MRKIKSIIKKAIISILWCLPRKLAHKLLYRITMKEKLEIDNPKTLNEKTQYMIIKGIIGEKETKLTDKFLVRNYIIKNGYKENLPKLYNTYKNANEINLESLPDKFVLKTNNGSGDVLICKNKVEFASKNFKKILNKNINKNFAKTSLEYHYNNIAPLIICEEFLDDGTGKVPIDYKIWCFAGKAKYIMVCLDRETDVKKVYYDLEWNYLKDFSKYEYKKIEKPDNLKEMIEIAERLSEGFKMIRVDLYNINNKIYVGELTFTSDAGMCRYLTDKGQIMLGNEIVL